MIDIAIAFEHDGVRAATEEILSRERDIRIVEPRTLREDEGATPNEAPFVWVLDERAAARHSHEQGAVGVREQPSVVVLVSNPVIACRRFARSGWPSAVVALDDAVSDLAFAIRAAAQRRVFLSQSVSRARADQRAPTRRRWAPPRP